MQPVLGGGPFTSARAGGCESGLAADPCPWRCGGGASRAWRPIRGAAAYGPIQPAADSRASLPDCHGDVNPARAIARRHFL